MVDTTVATPDEVADCICEAFAEWQKDKKYRMAYVSTERINFPSDAPDEEKMALAESGNSPVPTLTERDGEFYLIDGLESALAATFEMKPFIAAKLVIADIPDGDFVKMKNSL